MLQPEQKSRSMMKELVRKFSKPGDLVLDASSGTTSPGNCDCCCTKKLDLRALITMVVAWKSQWQGLYKCMVVRCQNVKSDLKGREDLIEETRMYLSGVESRRLKQLLDSWEHHMVCFLYRRFRNMCCSFCARCIRNSHGSIKCGSSIFHLPFGRVGTEGVELGCGKYVRAVMRCDETWDRENNDWALKFNKNMVFQVQFRKWMVIGYHSGAVMYSDLYGSRIWLQGMEREWCLWACKCFRPTLHMSTVIRRTLGSGFFALREFLQCSNHCILLNTLWKVIGLYRLYEIGRNDTVNLNL